MELETPPFQGSVVIIGAGTQGRRLAYMVRMEGIFLRITTYVDTILIRLPVVD